MKGSVRRHLTFSVSHRTRLCVVAVIKAQLFLLTVTSTWESARYGSRLNKTGQRLSAKTAIICRPLGLAGLPRRCEGELRAPQQHDTVHPPPTPSHPLSPTPSYPPHRHSPSPPVSRLRARLYMNYWFSDLHFVCVGRGRGLACGQDHNDGDGDEEEGENGPHDGSGHGDGVWPLGLGLAWGRAKTHSFFSPATQIMSWHQQQRKQVIK